MLYEIHVSVSLHPTTLQLQSLLHGRNFVHLKECENKTKDRESKGFAKILSVLSQVSVVRKKSSFHQVSTYLLGLERNLAKSPD